MSWRKQSLNGKLEKPRQRDDAIQKALLEHHEEGVHANTDEGLEEKPPAPFVHLPGINTPEPSLVRMKGTLPSYDTHEDGDEDGEDHSSSPQSWISRAEYWFSEHVMGRHQRGEQQEESNKYEPSFDDEPLDDLAPTY